jgi:hypothetical protein
VAGTSKAAIQPIANPMKKNRKIAPTKDTTT